MTPSTENPGTLPMARTSHKRAISPSKTPTLPTPARIATPPPPSERGRLDSRTDGKASSTARNRNRASDSGRTILNADSLDSALAREIQRPQRESTPGISPSRKRQRINGDRLVYRKRSGQINQVYTDLNRFIPTRSGQDLQASFSLLHEDASPATPSKQKKRTPQGELHFQKSE